MPTTQSSQKGKKPLKAGYMLAWPKRKQGPEGDEPVLVRVVIDNVEDGWPTIVGGKIVGGRSVLERVRAPRGTDSTLISWREMPVNVLLQLVKIRDDKFMVKVDKKGNIQRAGVVQFFEVRGRFNGSKLVYVSPDNVVLVKTWKPAILIIETPSITKDGKSQVATYHLRMPSQTIPANAVNASTQAHPHPLGACFMQYFKEPRSLLASLPKQPHDRAILANMIPILQNEMNRHMPPHLRGKEWHYYSIHLSFDRTGKHNGNAQLNYEGSPCC